MSSGSLASLTAALCTLPPDPVELSALLLMPARLDLAAPRTPLDAWRLCAPTAASSLLATLRAGSSRHACPGGLAVLATLTLPAAFVEDLGDAKILFDGKGAMEALGFNITAKAGLWTWPTRNLPSSQPENRCLHSTCRVVAIPSRLTTAAVDLVARVPVPARSTEAGENGADYSAESHLCPVLILSSVALLGHELCLPLATLVPSVPALQPPLPPFALPVLVGGVRAPFTASSAGSLDDIAVAPDGTIFAAKVRETSRGLVCFTQPFDRICPPSRSCSTGAPPCMYFRPVARPSGSWLLRSWGFLG